MPADPSGQVINPPSCRILQICHDPRGPFVGICAATVTALPDAAVTTVFLHDAADSGIARTIGGAATHFLDEPRGGLRLGLLRRLARTLPLAEFDLVIAHRYKPIYLAILLGFVTRARPILGFAHETGLLRRWHRRWLTGFAGQLQLVAVSAAVQEDLEAYDRSAALLPHAIDPAVAMRMLARPAARQALGLPAGQTVIGTIGRLVRKKNHALLLDAFAALPGEPLMVLIGDGPERGVLETQALRLGISDRLVFAGHIDDARRLAPAFDVFVLSSDHREAFGIVLLEAMLARVPVVISDAPGPVAVVGDHGRVFRAGDAAGLTAAIQATLDLDESSRDQQVQAAADHVTTLYHPARFAARLQTLVRQQCQRYPDPASKETALGDT